jgi:DNA-binding transcriptional ArsR family regulator
MSSEGPKRQPALGQPVRVGGLAAMRALAHPTRVRMVHLLRSEPLSASELARRLKIPFGSAQFHLQSLRRAGIAQKAAERHKRGGTEVLFEVPRNLWIDLDPDAPSDMRQAMNLADPEDAERDVLTTREIELPPEAVPAAAAALHEFQDRLDKLALEVPTEDSIPFTVSVVFFRVRR